jgi:hypothetical protein
MTTNSRWLANGIKSDFLWLLRSRRIPTRKNVYRRKRYLDREERNTERISEQPNPEKRIMNRDGSGEYPVCPTRIPPVKQSRMGIKGR